MTYSKSSKRERGLIQNPARERTTTESYTSFASEREREDGARGTTSKEGSMGGNVTTMANIDADRARRGLDGAEGEDGFEMRVPSAAPDNEKEEAVTSMTASVGGGGHSIRIADLPALLQTKVAQLDITGDGIIDAQEFDDAIDSLILARKRAKKQNYIIVGLIVFVIILLGANFGLTYGVVELSRQDEVKSNGLMTVKGSSTLVRTSSADFTVSGGGLMANDGAILATSSKTSVRPLTSRISIDVLNAMTKVQLPVFTDKARGKQAMVSLSISGYLRELDGSKLVLYAKSGASVTVIGETISATIETNGVLTTLQVVPEELRLSFLTARRRRRSSRRRALMETENTQSSLPNTAVGDFVGSGGLTLGDILGADGGKSFIGGGGMPFVSGNMRGILKADGGISFIPGSGGNSFVDSNADMTTLPGAAWSDGLTRFVSAPAAGLEFHCATSVDITGKQKSNCESCDWPMEKAANGTCVCPSGQIRAVNEDDDENTTTSLSFHECICTGNRHKLVYDKATDTEKCVSCPLGMVVDDIDPGKCKCSDGSKYNYLTDTCDDVSCSEYVNAPDMVFRDFECRCPPPLVRYVNATLANWAEDGYADAWMDPRTHTCVPCALNTLYDDYAEQCSCALGNNHISVVDEEDDGVIRCQACPTGSIADFWSSRCECVAPLVDAAYDSDGTLSACGVCPQYSSRKRDAYSEQVCECDKGYEKLWLDEALQGNSTTTLAVVNVLNFRCVPNSCSAKGMVRRGDGECECRPTQYFDAVTSTCKTCRKPFLLLATDDPKVLLCECPEGLVKSGEPPTCAPCPEGMKITSSGHRKWCECQDGFFEDPDVEAVCRTCPSGLSLQYDRQSGKPKCSCPARTKKTITLRSGKLGRELSDYNVTCVADYGNSTSAVSAPSSSFACSSENPSECTARFEELFGYLHDSIDFANKPITPVWIQYLMPRPRPSAEVSGYLGSSATLPPILRIASTKSREPLSGWMLYAFSETDALASCIKFSVGQGHSTSPIPDSLIAPGSVARGEYTLQVNSLPEAGLIVLFYDEDNKYSCSDTMYGAVTLVDMPWYQDPTFMSSRVQDKILFESDAKSVDVDADHELASIYRAEAPWNDLANALDSVHGFDAPIVIPQGGYAIREKGPSFPAQVFYNITDLSVLDVARNPLAIAENTPGNLYGMYGMYYCCSDDFYIVRDSWSS